MTGTTICGRVNSLIQIGYLTELQQSYFLNPVWFGGSIRDPSDSELEPGQAGLKKNKNNLIENNLKNGNIHFYTFF